MPTNTKKAIKTAFIELLEQRPINQISVKDIVEQCGINRNSFYYHFDDIPSLLRELMTETADRIISQYPDYDSAEDCICALLQYGLEHRRLLRHIYNSLSRELYEQNLVRVCESIVNSFFDGVLEERNISEADRQLLVGLYSCECIGLATVWLNGGMRADAVEQVRRLCRLRRGMLEEMLRRCEQQNME